MKTKRLTRNMGSFDRAVRAFVIAPIAIGIALGFGATAIGGIVLVTVAGVALATGATGFCPAYVPFGIDTRGYSPLPHGPWMRIPTAITARKVGTRCQPFSRS